MYLVLSSEDIMVGKTQPSVQAPWLCMPVTQGTTEGFLEENKQTWYDGISTRPRWGE